MAVETHYATVGLVRVAADGSVYSPSDTTKALKEALNFTTEHRVIPDVAIPNTVGHPTIQQYLNNEAADGFQPVQVAQYFIVTTKIT